MSNRDVAAVDPDRRCRGAGRPPAGRHGHQRAGTPRSAATPRRWCPRGSGRGRAVGRCTSTTATSLSPPCPATRYELIWALGSAGRCGYLRSYRKAPPHVSAPRRTIHRLAARQPEPLIQQALTHKEIFERYECAGAITRNPDAIAAMFTEDDVFDAPLVPDGHPLPRRLVGRDAIRTGTSVYHQQPTYQGTMNLEGSAYVLHETPDPDVSLPRSTSLSTKPTDDGRRTTDDDVARADLSPPRRADRHASRLLFGAAIRRLRRPLELIPWARRPVSTSPRRLAACPLLRTVIGTTGRWPWSARGDAG